MVDRERLLEILTAADGSARDLCRASAELIGVSGAGISVIGREGAERLCASNRTAARIEDLQYTLGEGPCLEAHHGGTPVAEPDLASPRRIRWPSFSPLAVGAGVAAMFAFPLRLGAVHLGALTLHEVHRGRLADGQHADALVMADVVASAVLAHQAEAPPGHLAEELEALGSSRATVHQAAGMVSAQLAVGVAEALVRLRAHAYAEGRGLREVAGDVVARRLRLGR